MLHHSPLKKIQFDPVKAQTDLTKSSCGIATPMVTVEPLLVELWLQKARMGQTLGIREGLCFANSIIEGTVHEEAMVYKHLGQSIGGTLEGGMRIS